MDLVIHLFVLCLGLAIGSFLNVCIYRLPAKRSLLRPGSHCPHCGSPIRPYDNIPLLSYLILTGRCRQCKAKISIRYPLVELLTGLLFVALFVVYGPTLQFLIFSLLVASLLVITLIDLDLSIIPDRITLPGIVIGLLLSPFSTHLGSGVRGITTAAIGLAVGGILFFLIALLGELIFKKESMGGGDIKLAAMLGAFLGWKGALVSFFLAFFVGAIVGGVMVLVSSKGRGSRIPFGPFLALGATCYLLLGDLMMKAYWLYVSLL